MLTIKKQAYGIAVLAIGAAACLLLSGCGPPGVRALHRGDDLIKHGQYEEAISTLREGVGLVAHDPPAVQARLWNLLGLAYQDTSQTADARKCYQQALKLDRNLSVVNYNLGCLELEDKRYAQAIDCLTTYTNVRPRDVIGYTKLGAARLRYGLQLPNQIEKHRQLEEARRIYEIGQSLAMTAEACNALGVIELERKTPPTAASIKAAEKWFATSYKYDPKFAPAVLNQAIICDQYLNDRKTALAKYKEYLLIETNAPNTKQVTAVAHAVDEELRISFVPVASIRETNAPFTNTITNPITTATSPTRPKIASPPPTPVTPPSPTQPAPTPVAHPVVQHDREHETVATVPKEPLTASTSRSAPPPVEVPAPVAPVPPPATNDSEPLPSGPPEPDRPLTNNAVAATTTNSPAPVGEAGQTNTAENSTAKGSEAPARKEGFVLNIFRRMNPANWFNRSKKTDDTPSSAGSEPTTPNTGGTQYAAPGMHYTPSSLSVLTRGDRATALKLVGEATTATRESRQTDALPLLQQALKADPTCYEACFALGMERLDERNYPAALDILYQALLIKEDSSDARYAYAWALERMHYYQDAAAELEKLVAQHSGEVRGHLLLGNIYARQLDQPKQARTQYAAVLALDPNNSQAPALRSWLHDNPAPQSQ